MEYESRVAVATRPARSVGHRSVLDVKRRAFPYLRSGVQFALAGALLAALLWRVNLGAVRDELASATLWWLPLAFAANLASDWFRAIRWQQFFAPMKRVGVPFLFAVAVLGVATNLALPLRAGEVLRVQVLRRRTGLNVSNILATLLSEKLADVVAFSTFILVGIILYEEAHFLWPLALVYGAVVVAGIWGARWLAARAQSAGPESDKAVDDVKSQPWSARLRREARSLGTGLQSFQRPRAILHVVWASHAAWLCEAVMYYACGRALGFDLSPAVYLLVVVAATIAVSVPVTQAGLGVFELAIVGLLVVFGVDESQAVAFAIFSHVMMALPYFATGPLAAIALRLSITDVLFLRLNDVAAPQSEAAGRPPL